jgi:peptidoglycan/LPS O-acetylase OafA/YrhL
MDSLRAQRLHFLDGLRGWAAGVVLLSHTFETWLISPEFMAQHQLGRVLRAINATPLGIAIDGGLAVYVFFAISGVALSYPFLTSERPARALTIMTLVRYPRLTIPVAASCLLAFLLLALGFFVNAKVGAAYPSVWLASFYPFTADSWHLIRFVFYDVYFRPPGPDTWNAVLWTMHIELAGSFTLFAFLAIPMPHGVRMVLAAAIATWLRNTSYAGFFAGVLIAGIIMRGPIRRSAWAAVPLLLIASVAAIAIRSQMIPGSLRNLNLIAICTVVGVALLPVARSALSAPISRFMGRISFSLYLVHLLVICSAGSAAYLITSRYLPLPLTIFFVAAVTISLSFGAAVAFERVVERHLLGIAKSNIVAFVDAVAFSRRAAELPRG